MDEPISSSETVTVRVDSEDGCGTLTLSGSLDLVNAIALLVVLTFAGTDSIEIDDDPPLAASA